MFPKRHLLGQFLLLTILGLLLLSLFDSNPWWKVVLYALATALIITHLGQAALQAMSPAFAAVLQGIVAALTAFLIGLTPLFRTTFGTLVGFALLVSAAELFLPRDLKQEKRRDPGGFCCSGAEISVIMALTKYSKVDKGSVKR